MGKIKIFRKQETIRKCYSPCAEGYQKLSIDWNGKVTCCCDFDNYLTIGNLKNFTLSEIWNNSKELKMYKELLDKRLHKSLTLCSTCYEAYKEFE